MDKKKIVISNSIGKDSNGLYIIHSPSRWSSGVKEENHFTYYPWELAYLSSLLRRDTEHEIKFIDGNLKKMNWEELSEEIIENSPDYLIMEPSTRTIEDDLRCLLKVKKETGASLILCGQHANAFPEELLNKGVDFIVLGEYEKSILLFFQGNDPKNIDGFYPNPPRGLIDLNFLPFPEDSDVRRIDYGIPGEPSSDYLEVQAYASRGCLKSCSFCVSRHLYYRKPYWRGRKIENIIEEIFYLKSKYPQMEGIFFDEECHNCNEDFIIELSKRIVKEKLNYLKFEAMCDGTLFNKKMLEFMREAGYYQIRVGIESASEKILKNINKGINLKRLENILKTAKNLGFLNYGTFVIGAPNSSEKEDLKTVNYIRYLIRNGFLDKLQVSILTPQPGTPFYYWVKKKGFLNFSSFSSFDGERKAVISYPNYPSYEIEEVKEKAVKMRDKEIFLRKLKKGRIISWALKIYKKHGLLKTLKKAALRLRRLIIPIFQK